MNPQAKIACTKQLVCAALAALALGCGDDDGPRSPEEKCEALARKYCGRYVGCTKESSSFRQQCEQGFITRAMCSRAIETAAAYSDCIDDLGDVACDLLLTTTADGMAYIPASCSNVVLYQ